MTLDFELSPYTGWTRAHWEATADRMLLAVRRYASTDHALIDLPGPPSRSGGWSDGLEGFARTFLLAAFRLAGADGADPLGLAEWYAAGLTAGTDPSSPQRWPRLDEIDQAKVEAASIAIALHETRPWIWDRLDPAVQRRLLDWSAVFAGAWVPDNNWVWFRAVVSAFCRSADGPWSAADIAWAIERTEDWYAGDGWYTDGGSRNFDHYNGWAMHLYPLWFCRIAGGSAETVSNWPGPSAAALGERYRDRLRRFLADAEHLAGGDGAPLFQGRSLTYRFAAAAPFWAGALFDATPLAPGLTRRIASGMLRYFLSGGCLRPDGTLSIGWHGEYLPIRQPYSGPGSPYWASKGFAGLLLPASDPAWQAVEQPVAVERGDFVRVMAAPGWVASGTAADGIVRVANHGTDHGTGDPEADDPFYCRWAYSTHTQPDLHGGLDSTVALIDARGRASHRRPLERVSPGVSRHQAHWPPDAAGEPTVMGPWLTTASALRGCWEVRAVRVDPGPGGPWILHMGGWAVPDGVGQGGAGGGSPRPDSVTVALGGALRPAVRGNDLEFAVVPGEIYAAGIALSASPAGPGEPPRVDIGPGAELRIRWADGHRDRITLDSAAATDGDR